MSEDDYHKAFAEAPEEIQAAIIKCNGPVIGEIHGQHMVLINGEYGDVDILFGRDFKADKYSALSELIDILTKYPHLITENTR